jgi:hypothetical protein
VQTHCLHSFPHSLFLLGVQISFIPCTLADSHILQSRVALHAAHPEWSTGEADSADLLGLKGALLEHAEVMAAYSHLNDKVEKALSLAPSSASLKSDHIVKLRRQHSRLHIPSDFSQDSEDELNGGSNGGGAQTPFLNQQEPRIVEPAQQQFPVSTGLIEPLPHSKSKNDDATTHADIVQLPQTSNTVSKSDGSYFLQCDGDVAFECFQQNQQSHLPSGSVEEKYEKITLKVPISESGRQQQNANVCLQQQALVNGQEMHHDAQVTHLPGVGDFRAAKLWVDKGSTRKEKEGNGAYEAAEQRLKVPKKTFLLFALNPCFE